MVSGVPEVGGGVICNRLYCGSDNTLLLIWAGNTTTKTENCF